MVQVVEGQMGAAVIERILADLGGKATSKQITEEIMRRTKQDNSQTFGSSLKDTANRALGHMKRDKDVMQVDGTVIDPVTCRKKHEWFYILSCRFCNKPRDGCICGMYKRA